MLWCEGGGVAEESVVLTRVPKGPFALHRTLKSPFPPSSPPISQPPLSLVIGQVKGRTVLGPPLMLALMQRFCYLACLAHTHTYTRHGS